MPDCVETAVIGAGAVVGGDFARGGGDAGEEGGGEEDDEWMHGLVVERSERSVCYDMVWCFMGGKRPSKPFLAKECFEYITKSKAAWG